MTIPNYITIFRLILIPVFLAIITLYNHEREYCRYIGLLICIIAIVSDLADGYIARKYNLKSELGARLDPLADKLAVNLGLTFIAGNIHFNYPIPLWFPPLVLIRDIVIVVGTYLISKKLSQIRVTPRSLGKITSFILSLYIAIVLLQYQPLINVFLIISTLLTILSLIDYLWIGIKFALSYKSAYETKS